MEGPLSKWTNVMKGWQYRWFVLDYNAGLLSYYTVRGREPVGGRQRLPKHRAANEEGGAVGVANGERGDTGGSQWQDGRQWGQPRCETLLGGEYAGPVGGGARPDATMRGSKYWVVPLPPPQGGLVPPCVSSLL